MLLGKIREEKEKMDNKFDFRLKKQVCQVIINKLNEECFEKELYYLAEITGTIDTESLLYDLIAINFRSEKLREKLIEVLNKYTNEEELIAIMIYEKSKYLLEFNEEEKIFFIVNQISQLCVEHDLFNMLIDFYATYEEYCFIREVGKTHSEFDLIKKVKEAAREYIKRFEEYEVKDYKGFFYSYPI